MKRLALNLASQHLTNQISTVWNKGHIVEGYDPNYLRLAGFRVNNLSTELVFGCPVGKELRV